MTHTTRIPVADELESKFADARTKGGIRFIQVLIQGEFLISGVSQSIGDSLENDWKHLEDQLQPKKPSYFLVRLDSQNDLGYEWLLVSYVPDGSPVKERMLYASTRDPLRKQLGKSYFRDTMHGSSSNEFTWEGYQEFVKRFEVAAPLTSAEVHYQNEVTAVVDHGTATQYVHSINFPLSNDAKNALKSYAGGDKNFVQLVVDGDKETIELGSTNNTDINALAGHLSNSEPRFTFFHYHHVHENESFESDLFIYSCPTKSPVKLRMLYSSVKSVVSGAAEEAGIEVNRSGRIEINEPDELAVDDINNSLHPKKEVKTSFARPMRPGRGKPRLTRTRGAK